MPLVTPEAGGSDQISNPAPVSENLGTKALPVILPLAASLLAAGAYALLRNAYLRFYSEFGVSPEDVGMSQTHFLSGVLRFCLAGAFLRSYTVVKLFVLLSLLVLVWWGVAHFCITSKAFKRAVPGTYGRVVVAVAIYLILLLVVLVLFALWRLPHDRQVASAKIRNSEVLHARDLALLSVQAFPARIVPVNLDGAEDLPTMGNTVMYLGQDATTLIVYDPTTSSTWRLPAGTFALRVLPQRSS